jgi:hypothetical protein
MSDERMQVLNMLAEGKISVDDAERLLARLEKARAAASAGGGAAGAPNAVGEPAPRSGAPRYLRILVDSADGDQVNVRVPLALVRTGIKLTALLPPDATQKLDEKGIDLSHLAELHGEEMVDALRELDVDVTTAQGDSVRVFCE